MENFVDLHLHSTCSDGCLTPSALVARAAALGLSAIAVADHDNVDGVPEAMAAGRQAGVEVVTGVELSVAWQEQQDIHLLGYDFDPHHKGLCRSLHDFRAFRTRRSRRILAGVNERLLEEGKRPLDPTEVKALAAGSLGRPHIGQALLNAGHVGSMELAFQRYLIPCNVPKRYFPIDEAIDLLHAAGGCAVLAHPVFIGISGEALAQLVEQFIALGLDGIEVYHAGADNATIDRHLTLARRHGLIATGGSDFHCDEAGGVELGRGRGNLRVTYRCVEEIHARSASYPRQ